MWRNTSNWLVKKGDLIMKYDDEHKKEIIKNLDMAINGFDEFLRYTYFPENNHNLDEDYPKHNSAIHFTDKSFDDFLVSLIEYRNHLECCFEEK